VANDLSNLCIFVIYYKLIELTVSYKSPLLISITAWVVRQTTSPRMNRSISHTAILSRVSCLLLLIWHDDPTRVECSGWPVYFRFRHSRVVHGWYCDADFRRINRWQCWTLNDDADSMHTHAPCLADEQVRHAADSGGCVVEESPARDDPMICQCLICWIRRPIYKFADCTVVREMERVTFDQLRPRRTTVTCIALASLDVT